MFGKEAIYVWYTEENRCWPKAQRHKRKIQFRWREKDGAAETEEPAIHREVGAVICLLLAIFSALGYFDIRAIFVTFLTQLERGLLGYGFWLMPIVLLAASIELFRHFGRPVRLQLTFTLLLPLVAGACVHTVLCTGDYQLKQGIVQTLWDAGIAMRSGGVLSGLLSMGLTWVFSAVGCMILLLIALAACVQMDTRTPNVFIQEQSLGIHYNQGSDLLDYLADKSVFAYENGFTKILDGPGWHRGK